MPSLFEVLSLPCDLSITTDQIDAAWRELSQKHHPDRSSRDSGDVSAQLNEAREILSKPSGLLSQWLEAREVQAETRNAALSSDLMDLFSSVSDSLRVADSTIEEINQSQTALAKSLLAGRAVAAQQSVQARLGDITTRIGSIKDRFPAFEKAAQDSEYSEALAALGELKFLDKWQRECQQRLLELISI